MVGELEVAIADQHATVEFCSDEILVRFASFLEAVAAMRRPLPKTNFIGRLLRASELKLSVQIGNRKPFEVFPKSNRLFRWISPSLNGMFVTEKIL